MDSYEDWLRLYDITPPVDYMKRDSIFSQIAIENSYEFGKITRRPHICGGFISSHQLLGPYVILTFNETNRQVNSKILPGKYLKFDFLQLSTLIMRAYWSNKLMP